MFLLVKSERWAPYREYWFDVHGTMLTTAVFGLLTVLMTPILIWTMKRGENAIQFLFGARTLAKLLTKSFENGKNNHFIESIVGIPQQCQIPFHSKGLKQNLKVICGVGLSKTYMIALFGVIYGLDQLRSDGFSCRNLKDGVEFLLSNDTGPANHFNATFTQMWEMREEIGINATWVVDQVNGFVSDYAFSSWWFHYFDEMEFSKNFSETADLIESFNLVGFHEVCNTIYLSEHYASWLLPPWFEVRNATGQYYQNKLTYYVFT